VLSQSQLSRAEGALLCQHAISQKLFTTKFLLLDGVYQSLICHILHTKIPIRRLSKNARKKRVSITLDAAHCDIVLDNAHCRKNHTFRV